MHGCATRTAIAVVSKYLRNLDSSAWTNSGHQVLFSLYRALGNEANDETHCGGKVASTVMAVNACQSWVVSGFWYRSLQADNSGIYRYIPWWWRHPIEVQVSIPWWWRHPIEVQVSIYGIYADSGVVYHIVADYFACQKFCGLATKRDTQIFRGGKFSLITSAKKKKFRS